MVENMVFETQTNVLFIEMSEVLMGSSVLYLGLPDQPVGVGVA